MNQPVIIPSRVWDQMEPQNPLIPTLILNLIKKLFFQIVNNICDISVSQLPKPSIKGDMIAITIPKEEYLTGLETCKLNLHIIIYPKGPTPLKVDDLRNKLSSFWESINV